MRAAASALAAASCSTLYGYDSPRATLLEADTFHVDPPCVDLPVDNAGPVRPESHVTLTGRREATHLGAEGVPVSVRLGNCESEDLAGRLDPGNDASSQAGNEPSASVQQNQQASCGSLGTGDLELGDFELLALEGRGCRSRSRVRLDCTLNASGEASFGVTAHLPPGLLLDGSIPICITPNELPNQVVSSEDESTHQQTIFVRPRSAASRVALAAAYLDSGEAGGELTNGQDCRQLRDCGQVTSRARLQVGLMPIDSPRDAVRISDFRTVRRAVDVVAQLDTLTGPDEAYLSLDGRCGLPESGAPTPSLELVIDANHRSSPVVHVCSTGRKARLAVTPTTVSFELANSVEVVTTPLELDALLEGYSGQLITDTWTLYEHRCGEPPTVALSGASFSPTCLASTPDAGDGDAAVDAEVSQATGPCDPVIVPLQTGGSCSLVVER